MCFFVSVGYSRTEEEVSLGGALDSYGLKGSIGHYGNLNLLVDKEITKCVVFLRYMGVVLLFRLSVQIMKLFFLFSEAL